MAKLVSRDVGRPSARLALLLATIVATVLLLPAGVGAATVPQPSTVSTPDDRGVLAHGSDEDDDDEDDRSGPGGDDADRDDDGDDNSGPGGGHDDDDDDDASPSPSAGQSAGPTASGGAGAGGMGGTGGGQAATSATISMAGRAFSPRSVTIVAGGTVTFDNDDDDEHSATATDGSWDSGVLAAGASFDRTFPTPGAFSFLCVLHSDMTGTVNVQPADTAAPPAPPAPTGPSPSPSNLTAQQPDDPATPGTVDVAMVDIAFEPGTVEALAGSKIRWTNRGQAPHTATAEGGAFDSGFVASGDTFEITLDEPGTYAYLCQLHPGMAGSIVVTAGAGAPTGTGANPPAATASPAEPSATPSTEPPASPSASAAPVAAAVPGDEARTGGSSSPTLQPAAAGATLDLGRLAIVVLLVGAAMGLFGRIVRSTVRTG